MAQTGRGSNNEDGINNVDKIINYLKEQLQTGGGSNNEDGINNVDKIINYLKEQLQTGGGSNNEDGINNVDKIINCIKEKLQTGGGSNNEDGINNVDKIINYLKEQLQTGGGSNNEDGINNVDKIINCIKEKLQTGGGSNNEDGVNNIDEIINCIKEKLQTGGGSNNEDGINNIDEIINCLKEQINMLQDEREALLLREYHLKEMLIGALKKKKRALEWPIATDGKLRWDINDFAQKSKAAIIDESQRFVTSDDFFTPEGHRLCAVAYLNGHASFKGKGISLYVAIKKGPHDVTVAWPLPYTNIIFEIRSQRNGRHWEKNFPVDAQDLRFHQPTGEQNKVVGFDNFIDLAELEIPQNHFIEEDKMCVMITVN